MDRRRHGDPDPAPRQVGTWRRPQDWAALVIGVLVALAPVVVTTSAAAVWGMKVLGVVLALTGLWSLAAPSSVSSEHLHVVLGVLLFVAPWVLGYSAPAGASWTSWIGGILAVRVGAVGDPVGQPAAPIGRAILTAQH